MRAVTDRRCQLAARAGFEGAPLLLGLVLGPKMEVAFRQTLMISHGDFGIFFARPISLAFLLATGLFLTFPLIMLGLRRLRKGGATSAANGQSM